MDWTDRHCRYFHRLLSRKALLYTEMVTTGALIHGDVARHLRLNDEEHPVALQLGGSEPADLARCAKLGEDWGYDEINLNCGCPSERVQRGSFGACLMAEPRLVADCVKAMLDAVSVPVTVKHRIGIDKSEDYGFVRDFVGQVGDAGCRVFIVHARNAWLKGLSPKANRELPPLHYETVYRLKADFPQLTLVVNGGIQSLEAMDQQLQQVDGVMLGREVYHKPWMLTEWDARFHGATAHEKTPGRSQVFWHPLGGPGAARVGGAFKSFAGPPQGRLHPLGGPGGAWVEGANPCSRESIEQQMVAYMAREGQAHGTPWSAIARHMLGLRHGLPGARRWRQVWSDHGIKGLRPAQVMRLAHQEERLAA